jgi:hypothetical protein
VLALARKGSRWGDQGESVTRLIEREIAEGVLEPMAVASLNESLASSAAGLATYLAETLAGYSAASRASALMRCARLTAQDLIAVADAAPGLHGRSMPGSRIPIVPPRDLVAMAPDKVLLFVPDLLNEVRQALPEIELNGGQWVVVDPLPREIDRASSA